LASGLGSIARAATVAEAARVGDIVVGSVPAAAFVSLPAAPLAGKVVICTPGDTARNEDRDEEEGDGRVTIADLLQRELPASYVVAASSTVALASVPLDGSPPSTPGRRAIEMRPNQAVDQVGLRNRGWTRANRSGIAL
jgi:8-hydroxy-5-deazaflavin:NADPH oxidoreductase